VRDCIVVTTHDVWIKVRETFVHLGHVQQNRADICSCSQPAGTCEMCQRSLGDVLEGGDVLLSAVRCDNCGQKYPYVDAPRACTVTLEARGNPRSFPEGSADAVTPRRT
jgi:hypothetical protein